MVISQVPYFTLNSRYVVKVLPSGPDLGLGSCPGAVAQGPPQPGDLHIMSCHLLFFGILG